MKRLLVVLALLIALPAFAEWKFNPFTGKQDYYEPAGAPADNAVTPAKLKAIGTPDNTMVPFWDSAGLFRWQAVTGGGTPSGTVALETTYGAASNAGAAATYSRGDHTHGSVPLPRLDQIADPNDNVDISLGTNHVYFRFVNPTSVGAGAFEIEAIGAYTGDLLHIHQHTGNPGPGTHLVHIEAEDPDVVPLHVVSGGSTSIEVDKQYRSTLATGTAPFDLASTTKSPNLNADLLDDLSSADFALAGAGVTGGNSHDHSGGDGAQIAYGSLSGTPTIPADISGAKYVTMQAEAGLAAEVVVPTCTGTEKLSSNGTVISCEPDVSGGSPTLDSVGDPVDNTALHMGGNRISFHFDNVDAGVDGAFEFEATGDFGTTFVHIHQHTGDLGASSLLDLEADDIDVLPLEITAAGSTAISVNKAIESTLPTGLPPFVVASTTKTGNLNADLLDDLDSSAFAVAAKGVTNGDSHDHSGGDGAQIVYSTLGSIPSTFAPSAHATGHVTGGGDVIANAVASGNAGLMSGTDKAKLDGIASGAEVNVNADWSAGSGDGQILNKPTILAFSDAEGDPAGIGTVTDGTSANAARRDHVHAGDHVNLANKGTNTHAQIDTFISSKASASGLASLDAGSLVVQNPTNATATPTASKIVIADGGGKVDGWISASTDAIAGKVELATDAETVTGTDTARAVTPANARAAYTPTNIAATPGADHSSTGPTTNALNAGGTITVMDLVILNSSSQWVQTDANAAATYAGMLAISLESKTSGQAMKVALPGSFVRDDTWNWTPGAVLYLSETAGQITSTQPTTTDAAIRVIGYALTADVIYFAPSPDWITHT